MTLLLPDTLSCLECGDAACYGSMLDDRWYEQTFPEGTYPGWHFKPLELLLFCDKHVYQINSFVLTFAFRKESIVITPEKIAVWQQQLDNKEAVVYSRKK